jgi:hypothetical protein
MFLLFGRRASVKSQRKHQQQQQIKIESARVKIHSSHTKSQPAKNVKTLMGKQHNKDEHKKRRKAYIKRKKASVKTKKNAAKK